MWPLLILPPFARLWISVSSKSITSVFCVSLVEACEDVWAEYDGCRLGMRGRGGVGARGYLVSFRDEAGDVGDFMFATVSVGC